MPIRREYQYNNIHSNGAPLLTEISFILDGNRDKNLMNHPYPDTAIFQPFKMKAA